MIPAKPSPERLDLLLSQVDDKCELSDILSEAISFEADCLRLVCHAIPPQCSQDAELVFNFKRDRPTRDAAGVALGRCWTVLKKDYPGKDVDDVSVSAVRALICALTLVQAKELGDVVDDLGFFLEMLHHVEPHFEEEESLIRSHFGQYLD